MGSKERFGRRFFRQTIILGLAYLGNAPDTWADESESGGWVIAAGGGIVSSSRSIGSGRQFVLPVPLIEARYRDWFFATDNPYEGIGVEKKLSDECSLALALGLDLDTRDPSEDPRVRGLPRLGVAPSLRAKWTYQTDRIFGSVVLADRVAAAGQRGLTSTFELGWNALITERWLGSIGVSARVMDHDWADNFLSILPSQSSSSRLPAHSAKAGLLDAGTFAQAVLRINDYWTFFARLQVNRFVDSGASSPVISNRNEPVALLFASRSF